MPAKLILSWSCMFERYLRCCLAQIHSREWPENIQKNWSCYSKWSRLNSQAIKLSLMFFLKIPGFNFVSSSMNEQSHCSQTAIVLACWRRSKMQKCKPLRIFIAATSGNRIDTYDMWHISKSINDIWFSNPNLGENLPTRTVTFLVLDRFDNLISNHR